MTNLLGDTTVDAFLGGALSIEQPAQGYRAATDPVLLAAAVPAHAGQSVLELGCGVGTASLCLGSRVPNLKLIGVEVQDGYAELARANALRNGIEIQVVTADLAGLPDDLRAQSFNHVMFNPPFFDRSTGSAAQDPGRETGLGEGTPLAVWMEVAARRILSGGTLTIIQKAARLPDLLTCLPATMGSVTIWPLTKSPKDAPGRVILTAIKGGRAAFKLAPAQTIHMPESGVSGRRAYTPTVDAILRDGISWPWVTH